MLKHHFCEYCAVIQKGQYMRMLVQEKTPKAAAESAATKQSVELGEFESEKDLITGQTATAYLEKNNARRQRQRRCLHDGLQNRSPCKAYKRGCTTAHRPEGMERSMARRAARLSISAAACAKKSSISSSQRQASAPLGPSVPEALPPLFNR